METIIGPSVKVKGNFSGAGNMVVEGILEGSLKTGGHLIVGEKAKISGNIEAQAAQINGEVAGNIKVEGALEIAASAKINGDLEMAELAVARGASVNGKCAMKTFIKEKEEKQ